MVWRPPILTQGSQQRPSPHPVRALSVSARSPSRPKTPVRPLQGSYVFVRWWRAKSVS